ncbi:RhuM family protein [Methylocaldum marinum]|uniref:RhuM family protein n=1 Tax=Methylocaldum marinum TaxID=1432792 RepID=UPI0038CBFAC5
MGYRVRSVRGTQSRRWATERLREYPVRGFAGGETTGETKFSSRSGKRSCMPSSHLKLICFV